MYVHIGGTVTIPLEDVVGIFDLDHCSTSHITRGFLKNGEEEGMILTVEGELPKSMVVTCPRGSWQRIYLSPLNAATLQGRIQEGRLAFYP